MASNPRLILQFAAASGIAAMLLGAAPAMAAESAVPARETAVTAKTMPSVVKHRAWRGNRIEASHYARRVGAIRNLDCSGIWCGRQFVLMVGIGY